MSLFSKKLYKTLNTIEVSSRALLNNYSYFQKENPKVLVCPVLKSNAYGHGLKLIGKFVANEIKPEFICVDSLYEAYELKKEKIKTKILIMGWTFPDNFKYKKIDFSLPLFDLQTLSILNKYQPGINVHLKIDTGMNRLGIKENQYEQFLAAIKKNTQIKIEGIYSHLCDTNDKIFSTGQIFRFKKAISFFESSGLEFKYKHLFSTSGAFKYQDDQFNLIRLGLGFYGISPFEKNSLDDKNFKNKLIPALKLKSHLVEIKIISKGETVSYSRTFKAKNDMVIGLLPLGYYDGLNRSLSNIGFVKYKDSFCPIIGNICMNMTMIDLSEIKNPSVGDEIIVFDNDYNSPNSINASADKAGTIPYELLTNLSETTRRVLV